MPLLRATNSTLPPTTLQLLLTAAPTKLPITSTALLAIIPLLLQNTTSNPLRLAATMRNQFTTPRLLLATMRNQFTTQPLLATTKNLRIPAQRLLATIRLRLTTPLLNRLITRRLSPTTSHPTLQNPINRPIPLSTITNHPTPVNLTRLSPITSLHTPPLNLTTSQLTPNLTNQPTQLNPTTDHLTPPLNPTNLPTQPNPIIPNLPTPPNLTTSRLTRQNLTSLCMLPKLTSLPTQLSPITSLRSLTSRFPTPPNPITNLLPTLPNFTTHRVTTAGWPLLLTTPLPLLNTMSSQLMATATSLLHTTPPLRLMPDTVRHTHPHR